MITCFKTAAIFVTSVTMALIGVFILLQTMSTIILPFLDQLSWLPLALSIIPPIMMAIGILPVLHSLMSEIFPTEIRLIRNNSQC